MNVILAVAAGGALGAVGRHFVNTAAVHLFGTGFPMGTLAVNVVGSFIMGLIVEASALVWSPGLQLRAFLTVGILGAFTTFSTFSLDVAVLYERGALGLAAGYVVLSVVLSVAALFSGLALVRHLVV